jgi:hypothetical protein
VKHASRKGRFGIKTPNKRSGQKLKQVALTFTNMPENRTHWHYGVMGLAQIAAPAPAVKGLMQTNNSLSAFQIDISKEIESAVGALFDGISVQHNRKNSSRKR